MFFHRADHKFCIFGLFDYAAVKQKVTAAFQFVNLNICRLAAAGTGPQYRPDQTTLFKWNRFRFLNRNVQTIIFEFSIISLNHIFSDFCDRQNNIFSIYLIRINFFKSFIEKDIFHRIFPFFRDVSGAFYTSENANCIGRITITVHAATHGYIHCFPEITFTI